MFAQVDFVEFGFGRALPYHQPIQLQELHGDEG